VRRGPAIVLLLALLLSAGYGAGRLMQEGRHRIAGFSPTHLQAARSAEGVPPLAQRLVLVVVEGLQPDDVLTLPSLDWLAQQGASLRLSVPQPGYAAPGAATLLTGAAPRTHGVFLPPAPGQSLAADNLVAAAKRAGIPTGGAGAAALGDLLTGQIDNWQVADSPAVLQNLATPLLGTGGPRLVVLHTDYLHRESRRLRTADRTDTLYRTALAELDGHLARLLEQVDWKTTAVMVAGIKPMDAKGAHVPNQPVPLVMAGPGLKPAYRGAGSLTDVAPTVSALLGAPVPVAADGRPLLEAMAVSGRPADVVVQQALASRRAYADAALKAMGSKEFTPDPPSVAAGEAGYKQQLEQLLSTARFEAQKALLLRIGPYAGGALLLILIYLFVVLRRFGSPIFVGIVAFAALFHMIFFLTGGRYSFAMAGLESPDAQLVWGLAGRSAGAMALAVVATGHLLARRGVKKRSYVSTAACHLALSTVLVMALPVAVTLVLSGWEFPVALPAPGLIVWFFVTGVQVMTISYLSPLWAAVAVSAASVSRRFWPPKEIGDPERNADKVVRLKALKRTGRR
jgi:hypothetical protein